MSMSVDRQELLALYQNAADNIFYFKGRVFWLVTSFSAGTAFLWNFIPFDYKAASHHVSSDVMVSMGILFYFLIASLVIILVLFSYRKKIEGHRQRIDRCCGLVQTKTKALCPEYKIEQTGQDCLGDLFFYGRTGEGKITGTQTYKKAPAFMAVHNDWADNLIGLALVSHVILITMFTAHRFCTVFLDMGMFYGAVSVYAVVLLVMVVYFKFFFQKALLS